MKNTLIIFILILAGCNSLKDDLKVTYIANCGFMYEYQTSKVLVDPFGTEFGNFFYLPTSETKSNIEKGLQPFNDIDLVLITHIHGDHFNPFVAEQFLLNNKNTKMICPPQVYSQIKDSCSHVKQIKPQIISPQISMNNLKQVNINNITITAARMQHGTDRSLVGIEPDDYTEYEKTENFGYIIDFSNKIIFHQGDACLKINKAAIEKIKQKIDIAYLSFFDWDSASYSILNKAFQPEQIIYMHGTKPAKELEKEEFKSIEPNLIVFKNELENRVFD